MRTVFKACMKFRQSVIKNKQNTDGNFPVYENLNNLISETMCSIPENEKYNKLSCLSRKCNDCGTNKLKLMTEELDDSDSAPSVLWEKYEYREVKSKDIVRKKLVLVRKQSKPKEIFEYLRYLLETFPLHQFRSSWQNKQQKHLVDNLPKNHCLLIHDFSENYRCTEKHEIQSSYFQKTEISIHVSLIYRHAVLEYDEVDSTEEIPNIICEQFIVFSDDETHDHHFTHAVEKLINQYLKSINCDVQVMHEFTDGCSTQYKSRHCMGDFSFSCKDFGYQQGIRNYFEPSHAKGPQDAAGGYIKHQADLSVIRGKAVIQCAEDLYKFSVKNLSNPGNTAVCKRRLFRLLKTVNRERTRYFKPVPENRQIRQIRTTTNGNLTVRKLSCYTCENCEGGNYNECSIDQAFSSVAEIKMVNENDDTENGESDEYSLKDLVSPGTIAAVRAADDPEADFYLIKANNFSQSLRKDVSDSWGAHFSSGTDVIRCNYFNKMGDNNLRYKLLGRRPAIVPSNSLVYICQEVDFVDNEILLPEDVHLRIIRSLY